MHVARFSVEVSSTTYRHRYTVTIKTSTTSHKKIVTLKSQQFPTYALTSKSVSNQATKIYGLKDYIKLRNVFSRFLLIFVEVQKRLVILGFIDRYLDET